MVNHHFFYRGGEKGNMKSFNSRRGVKVKKKQRYKNKILSMFLVSIMVFSMIPIQAYSTVDTVDSNGVEIKDEQLEKALKEEIKKINPEYNNENISKEDMELLVDVDLSNKGIKDLDGIEHAKNLKNINLEGNEITDISNLGSIEGLEKYNVSKQAVNISLNANEKNEAELSDVLKGIDGSKVLPTESDDISLKEDKIIFSNLEKGENIKTLEFKNSNEKGEFSGSLKVNILNESAEEIANSEKNEASEPKENNDLSDKKYLPEGRLITDAKDVSIRRYFGGGAQQYVLAGESYHSLSQRRDYDNYIRWYNNAHYNDAIVLGTSPSYTRDHRQQITIRSSDRFDMTKKIVFKGKLEANYLPYGFAIAFHNDPSYNSYNGYEQPNGAPAGALGFYKSDELAIYSSRGIDNAVVMEWDSNTDSNSDYGSYFDRHGEGGGRAHIAIVEPRSTGGLIGKSNNVELPLNLQQIEKKLDFSIEWDPSNNTMTFTCSYPNQDFEGTTSSYVAKYRVSDERANNLKTNGAYISLSTGIYKGDVHRPRYDQRIDGGTISVTPNTNKCDINQSIEYFRSEGGREIALGSGDTIREGDEIIVRHKISNKIKSNQSFAGTAILDKNDFRNSRLSLGSGNAGKWYTPYVIDNSFKTYIQGQNSDNSINKSDFINKREVTINIPDSSKTRVIEYKVKIPKVIGETQVQLRNKLRFTNEEFIGAKEVESFRNTHTGQNVIAINDKYLKSALIDSVRKKMQETYKEDRPSYFNGKVYWVELQELVDIDLSSRGITDLHGLQHCKNVTKINLSNNNIQQANIHWLEGNTKLKTLDLSKNNNITDVSILSRISTLKTLNLSNNTQISKESLGKLGNITDLTMNNAEIDDSYAKVIGGLTQLTSLSLNGNSISDLNNFSSLGQLNKLYLNYNKISDLRPLKDKIGSFAHENYSIKNQRVDVAESYLNSGDFKFENIVYNTKAIEKNINGAEYDASGNKVIWRDLQAGTRSVSYGWRNENFNFEGTVNINLKQVSSPDYLVVIPSTLKMGEVLDENSHEYDPEIDKNSIQYKPNKPVDKKNPIVSGVVGSKDIISINGDENVVGNINIYTDSVFTMTNTKDPEDTARVDVYKNFNDKLNGTASSKTEPLLSLNNNNRKKEFRIKATSSRFKVNNAEYRGTMNFIIEHVK